MGGVQSCAVSVGSNRTFKLELPEEGVVKAT